MMSHQTDSYNEFEPNFVDCSHMQCQCGVPAVIGSTCHCPVCSSTSTHVKEVIVYPPLQLQDDNAISNQQVEQPSDQVVVITDQSTAVTPPEQKRALISDMVEQQTSHKDVCAKQCAYGGRLIPGGNNCECFCNDNGVLAGDETIFDCEKPCGVKFALAISRKKDGCQSRCICSKNVLAFYSNRKPELKRESLVVESNPHCQELHSSMPAMTQEKCDLECGYGGQLKPYIVTLSHQERVEKISCNVVSTCMCSRESRNNSEKTPCQRECSNGSDLIFVENKYEGDGSYCHCGNIELTME